MSQLYRVAILGATGAVGTELLELLEERDFPIAELKLLASPRSAGSQLMFRGQPLTIEAVTSDSFKGVDIVLASAGGSISKQWVKDIVAAGAVMIDNSSAFRMDAEVPLVVPEVNPIAAKGHNGVIANPNCTTILMAVAVYPLHQVQPIRRIVAATYQSASGAGARAMEEVKLQSQAILNGEAPQAEILPYPLAFNLFPHNSPILENNYCEEEMKMVNETRKIFGEPDLRVTATCVRVPVLNWQKNYFPMPMDASGKDAVLVGRIRQDISHENSLDLWLCGDQIRKGAALNAVQIAELLIEKGWLKPQS